MSKADIPPFSQLASPAQVTGWFDSTSAFWTDVHDEIQRLLTRLERAVRGEIGDVQSLSGRTCGKNFLLFSYRTFSTADGGIEPVVIGITFNSVGDQINIEADVSGEESGEIVLPLLKKTVASSAEQVRAAVGELAARVHESAGAIVEALRDSSRRCL